MRKYLLLLCLCFSLRAVAQGPHVPSVLEFAGMRLHLNDAARKQIQADVDNLRRNENYFRRRMEIVDLHFPIIERIFKEENLPDDFKYLVIQESALVSDAISSSNAVGFWQFKKETALEMNLRVDHEVDERLNLISSSRAAARYLKKNNFYYNNWVYALLAYNTGRGGAEKYVKEKDFGKRKMDITGNTHWYVKKFLAHKIAYEKELGKSRGAFFLFDHHSVKGESLKDISREFEVDYDLVLEYNKCFKRKRVPDDKAYSVIIPIGFDKRDLIAEKVDGFYEKEKNSDVSVHSVNKAGSPVRKYYSEADRFPVLEDIDGMAGTYKINGREGVVAKPGDSFDALAVKGGVDLDDFYTFNDLTSFDRVQPGQVYYFQKKPNKAKTHYHTLMPGETLWEISQKYGIKMKKLLAKNRLEDESEAKAGLVLWLRYIRPRDVPAEFHDIRHFEKQQEEIAETNETKKPVEADPKPPKPYLVESTDEGDYFFESEESVEVEPQITDSEFTPGPQPSIDVRIDDEDVMGEETGPSERSSTVMTSLTHEVQKGDTYFNISRKYEIDVSDLLEWNSLKINDILSVGQQLVIKKPVQLSESKPPVSIENSANSAKVLLHTVTENDTLYGIAKKYEVTIKDLMEWNSKEDFVIKSGEELKIYQE